MTTIVQKFRRKSKLSSELHSRWGDVSISYPIEGSWSRWDQQSGVVANPVPEIPPEQSRGRISLDFHDRRSSSPRVATVLRSGDAEGRASSVGSATSIPRGHYDARVQCRSQSVPKQTALELGTRANRSISNPWDGRDFSDEEEDTTSALSSPRGRYQRASPRTAAIEEADLDSRASKSPPLSITSRMRRFSQQSTITELPTPASWPTSSKRSSATSTVPSLPSLPLQDPRRAHQEKKNARLPEPQVIEPAAPRHELVPSYEELYG